MFNQSTLNNKIKNSVVFKIFKKYRKLFFEFKKQAILEKKYSCTIDKSTKLIFDNIENISIAHGVYIGAFTTIHVRNAIGKNNSFLSIGANTSIGELNNIRASGGRVIIGEKCLISQHVNIIAANHNTEIGNYIVDQPWSEKDNFIIIGNDVWVGCGATILPGVKIGNGAIIGAGSVVTKNVPDNTIYTGIPAKFLKHRT